MNHDAREAFRSAAREGIAKAKEVTRRLRAFSGHGSLESTSSDPEPACKATIKLHASRLSIVAISLRRIAAS